MSEQWPRLASLPTTQAMTVTGIFMALATMCSVLLGWDPPEGWYMFVLSVMGVGAAQFGLKRATWKPESPQNGDGEP